MASKYEKIFCEVLQKYDLCDERYAETQKSVDAVLRQVAALLKHAKIKAEVCLGGSAAKGTYIPHDFDCDIFVRFNYPLYHDKDLSSFLARALRSWGVKRLHGSRDYFQKVVDDVTYEIIPVLLVADAKNALNVTDMSPLHVVWVSKNRRKDTSRDIILAKLFCKAQKIYGAESYIHGFSGHVLDILVIYYGSFTALVHHAARWSDQEILDVEQHYPTKAAVLRELNKAKLQSPLILVDPLQKNRNAAAALSLENYHLFIAACKAFLKSPSSAFFEKKKFSVDILQRTAAQKHPDAKLFIMDVVPLSGKVDVVGTQLLKAYLFIRQALEHNGFEVHDASWEWNKGTKASFWFIVKDDALSSVYKHPGPPVKMKEAVAAFKKKHGRKCFISKGRVYASLPRPYRTPSALLKALLSEPYVTNRMKKISMCNQRKCNADSANP